jgi:hypothetical protein
VLPPRSTVGQQILDLLIGVRIPGGQPNSRRANAAGSEAFLALNPTLLFPLKTGIATRKTAYFTPFSYLIGAYGIS